MSAVTSASLCWTSLSLCFLFVSAGQKNITSESGQNVTLPCRAPNNNIRIIAVEWSRADLGDEYVLLYRDGRFEPDGQHPSFKNRVDLQDRQMKDGDVSLILKDVTINDTGTYECRVFSKGRNDKPISIIYLR
ncbi:programmed cell death 1 ligand 1-like [Oreochromis niloticus]|uniref:programmed cell death 1 ligand 1-like n=1 Tax=Oreochromis niloticus TaxID=8128 RepID=UPI000DF4B913|nr:programmed cell death 1 ligand 1-like [Oreochromis niloticus]